MVGRPAEVELKLWVAPENIAALRNYPGFASSLQNPSREVLDSVYFDSDERYLRNHGLTLRVRYMDEKRVQTIKSADHGVGLFERSEWESAIEGDQPDLSSVKATVLVPLLTEDLSKTL